LRPEAKASGYQPAATPEGKGTVLQAEHFWEADFWSHFEGQERRVWERLLELIWERRIAALP
jgi:hypothetical protein